MVYSDLMSEYLQLPAGSHEKGVHIPSVVTQKLEEHEGRTLLEIQHGIIWKACNFVIALDYRNPSSMASKEGIGGRIARAAILRSMGLVDIPENAQYLQSQRRYQTGLISARMDYYPSNSPFTQGVEAAQKVLVGLASFITRPTELRSTNQHNQIILGNFPFSLKLLNDQLGKDHTGISFMRTLSLRDLNSHAAQEGIILTAEMFTAAHTYFTDMEIDEIVRVRRYSVYYVNEDFLRQIDGLIAKLTPPPVDLSMY